MKITGPGRVETPASRRAEKKGGDKGAFVVKTGADDAAARGVSASHPLAAIDALIALQQVPEPTPRQKAVKRGKDMLDLLDEIRIGLLEGGIPQPKLDQLVKVVSETKDQIEDPRLGEVLDEIELRARVELAKLGHFM